MYCVLSNNYSQTYRKTSVKFRALQQHAQTFFGPSNVFTALSSRFLDVAAVLPQLRELVQKGQVLYVSSGSDLDPGMGTSAADLLETVLFFKAAGCPVLLICWAFQTFLLNPKTFWTTGATQPFAVQKVHPQSEGSNTFHKCFGVSVVSNHRFGSVVVDFRPAAFDQAKDELQRWCRIALNDPTAELVLRTYTRNRQRVLSFFQIGLQTFGTQFHPELAPQSVHRKALPLLQFFRLATLRFRFMQVAQLFEVLDPKAASRFSKKPEPASCHTEATWVQAFWMCPPPVADKSSWRRKTGALLMQLDSFLEYLFSLRKNNAAKFKALLNSHFQAKLLCLLHLSSKPRASFGPGRPWPQPADFNGGFQPSGSPAVMVFRAESLEEVARHEVCHIFCEPDFWPALHRASHVAQTVLEASGLVCPVHSRDRSPRFTFRAKEGFVETFSNLATLTQLTQNQPSRALAFRRRREALQQLLSFLDAKCLALAASQDWQTENCLVQTSCVFSYFFLRRAILKSLTAAAKRASVSEVSWFHQRVKKDDWVHQVTASAVAFFRNASRRVVKRPPPSVLGQVSPSFRTLLRQSNS